MSSNKKMQRGVQQALYKYLPGSWVDFTTSGGGVTYAVHVDNWNSVHLVGINNKRLLRVINQRVQEFISNSPDGPASVVDFAQTINEDTYDVLTPKISDQIGAIQTSVKPWVFICNSCGRVRQYYTYDEFKSKEHKPCDVCGKHMTQLRMIRFCKCGFCMQKMREKSCSSVLLSRMSPKARHQAGFGFITLYAIHVVAY